MALSFDSLTDSASALISVLPVGYFLLDETMQVIDCNAGAEQILKLSRQEILKRSLRELFHLSEDGKPLDLPAKTDAEKIRKALDGMLAGVQRADGSLAWVRVHTNGVNVGSKEAVIVSLTDVTQQRQVVDQLKSQVQSTDELLDSIPAAIFFSDAYGKVQKSNRSFKSLCALNREASSIVNIFDFVADSGIQARLMEDFQKLERGNIEEIREAIAFRTQAGKPIDAMLIVANGARTSSAHLLVGYVENISDFLLRDDEKMKASKFEALALLSGGVAHDLNNILLAITANLELAGIDLSNHENVSKFLNDAMLAAKRAGDLSKRLVTFAKGGNPIKEVVDVTQQIISTVQFALRGSNLTPSFRVAPDLFPVEVDLTQFSQVLDNLVINAREACPNGGVLDVQASNQEIQEDNVHDLKPGWYVEIIFRDPGTGISEENLLRVFDPYFSTKPHGSGIGLSTCYSILKNHSGVVFVCSEKGKGSVFTILLPSANPLDATREAHQAVAEAHPQETIRDMAGEGRILIVDDEAMILNILKSMLKSLGYDATASNRTEDGLIKYREAREKGAPFNAVILDATIPGGIGGEAALRKFLELDPEARVVICSGYTNNKVMLEYDTLGFKGKLEKPFKISELGNVLKAVVSAGRG